MVVFYKEAIDVDIERGCEFSSGPSTFRAVACCPGAGGSVQAQGERTVAGGIRPPAGAAPAPSAVVARTAEGSVEGTEKPGAARASKDSVNGDAPAVGERF